MECPHCGEELNGDYETEIDIEFDMGNGVTRKVTAPVDEVHILCSGCDKFVKLYKRKEEA